uniref:receptor-interacting serine/threonine-protein kinase 2-like n=1 Tax=Styela clava TaxID=7725 RepID=UPI00193932B9|nr:receptor-interacting serine/threonine-protein kinase 2-like [Styela clava]
MADLSTGENIYLYKNLEKGFLGKGSFGQVYQCFDENNHRYAIKLYKLQGDNRDIAKVKNEINKEVNLLQLMKKSGNVINVYRCVKYTYFIGIVTEYMPHGDLNFLMQQKEHFIPLSIRLQILHDTARGLDHLHSLSFDKRITHNDLKPANVLLDDNFHAKICDLGGANIAEYTSDTLSIQESHSTVHTIRYAAPEFLDEDRRYRMDSSNKIRRTRGMDIYSFGMVIYFVLTKNHPFFKLHDKAEIKKSIISGTKPELEVSDIFQRVHAEEDKRGLIESLVGLAKQCWKQDESERPENARWIRKNLKELSKFNVEKDVKELQEKFPTEQHSTDEKIPLDVILNPFNSKLGQYSPASKKIREDENEKAYVQ